jgi:uncharacterized protein
MSKFVVYKDKSGKYRWKLVARNGENVAASESYSSKLAAEKAATRAKTIAIEATIVFPKKPKKKACSVCKQGF